MKRLIAAFLAAVVLSAVGALGVSSDTSAALPHEAGRDDSKCAHWGYWTETFAPSEMDIFMAEMVGFSEADLLATGDYDPKVRLRYYIGAGCTSWHLRAAKTLARFIVAADVEAYQGFYREFMEDPNDERFGLGHKRGAPTSSIPLADKRRMRGRTLPAETLSDIEAADTLGLFAPARNRKWIVGGSDVWLPSCEFMHGILAHEREDSYNTEEQVWAVWKAAVYICEAHCLAQGYGLWLSWLPEDGEDWRLRCGARHGSQVPQIP